MRLFLGVFLIYVFLQSCTSVNDSQSESPKNNNWTTNNEELITSMSDSITKTDIHELENDALGDIGPQNKEKIANLNISKNSSSGLNAGFADDNKQFNYYLNFLNEYKVKNSYPIDISERIIFNVMDNEEKSLFKIPIEIFSNGKLIESGVTGTDGSYLFFPSEYPNLDFFEVNIIFMNQTQKVDIAANGKREYSIEFDKKRSEVHKIPLDIVFVMDTTGSMGEEIERLKRTIEIIYLNLVSLSSQPQLRFGMVLYKDRGDEEYITRIIPLTSDL